MKQQHYDFIIHLSYLECQQWLYQSGVPAVVLRAVTGERVQVPVARLRQLVTPQGIVGRYRLEVGKNHQTQAFYRCSDE